MKCKKNREITHQTKKTPLFKTKNFVKMISRKNISAASLNLHTFVLPVSLCVCVAASSTSHKNLMNIKLNARKKLILVTSSSRKFSVKILKGKKLTMTNLQSIWQKKIRKITDFQFFFLSEITQKSTEESGDFFRIRLYFAVLLTPSRNSNIQEYWHG